MHKARPIRRALFLHLIFELPPFCAFQANRQNKRSLRSSFYILPMPSSQHFVYILRCRGNRLYTGYATNVQARYAKHLEGTGARFTKAFPPSEILRVFQCPDKSSALRLEAAIKKLRRPGKESLVHRCAQAQASAPYLVEHIEAILEAR